MRVEVDTGGALLASAHLVTRGSLVRGQRAGCARLPAGLRDPSLRAGVADLADATVDVLELVARDLELLATRVRDAAVLYDRVEALVRDEMAGP